LALEHAIGNLQSISQAYLERKFQKNKAAIKKAKYYSRSNNEQILIIKETLRLLSEKIDRFQANLTQSLDTMTQNILTMQQSNPAQQMQQPFTFHAGDNIRDQLWAFTMNELINLNHPLIVSLLTLFFITLQNKTSDTAQYENSSLPLHNNTAVSVSIRKTLKKTPLIIRNASIANIFNALLPTISSLNAKNGWLFILAYTVTDMSISFLQDIVPQKLEKTICKTIACKIKVIMQRIIQQMPSIAQKALYVLTPELLKTIFAYILCPPTSI
jgi:hypothetical protein